MAVHGCDHFIARACAVRGVALDATGQEDDMVRPPALSLNFTASDFGRYGSRRPAARQPSAAHGRSPHYNCK
ncbi:hypothetical protein BO443_70288 [Burkholderia orbicola]